MGAMRSAIRAINNFVQLQPLNLSRRTLWQIVEDVQCIWTFELTKLRDAMG